MNEKESAYILRWAKKHMAITYLGGKCSCGETRKTILTFHHDGSKQENVARLLDGRWSRIIKEIENCEILCRNCHADLHCKQAWDSRARQLKERLLGLKGIDRCQRCSHLGETVGSLDFHHREGTKKNFSFGEFTSRKLELTWDEVVIELDKCDVLCGNCHALEHFDMQRYESMLGLIESSILNYKEKQPAVEHSVVIGLRASGLTYREIARKIPCSISTVSSILKPRAQVA